SCEDELRSDCVSNTRPSRRRSPFLPPHCLLRSNTSFSVAAFQSLTMPSLPPEAKVLPSGENATQLISIARPLRVISSWPVATSHSFTVLSKLPVANLLPSGENTTDLTVPSCPLRVPNSWPLTTSNNLTVPSSFAVAKVLPSGENAIEWMFTFLSV